MRLRRENGLCSHYNYKKVVQAILASMSRIGKLRVTTRSIIRGLHRVRCLPGHHVCCEYILISTKGGNVRCRLQTYELEK